MGHPTNKIYYCPIEVILDLIEGKWKPMVLEQLDGGVHDLDGLRRRIPLATQKMLLRQLRELDRDGLVRRRPTDLEPAPAEYELTEMGERLGPILSQLKSLGVEHAESKGVLIHRLWEMGDASTDGIELEDSSSRE